jgi:hypothetical protein
MSRSFTPPGSLSKEEIRTIADVRRDIWTNSFYGIGYGSLTGITGHTILSFMQGRGWFGKSSLKLNRNTALLCFLGGGALGSFLAASTTGKNQVHNLHPIFQVGAQTPPGTPYQKSIATASSEGESTSEDRLRNRNLRRKTLKKTLENPNGLNDSHGGRWVNDSGRNDKHVK